MTKDLECPRCKHEFEAEEWTNGKCPKCGNKYSWDEMCTENYDDRWCITEWENYR